MDNLRIDVAMIVGFAILPAIEFIDRCFVMRKSHHRYVLLLGFLALLAGCGQKGDLYLSREPAPDPRQESLLP
jgi:predicted small lipoprotein YifL